MRYTRAKSYRSKSGVARIRRHTYASNSGFQERNSWWDLHDQCRKRAGGKCEVCGEPGSEPHHIVPLSRGGCNTLSNLLYLCKSCHNRRHNHLFRSR